MVNVKFINVRSIPDDVRYKVFDHLWYVKEGRFKELRHITSSMIKNIIYYARAVTGYSS